MGKAPSGSLPDRVYASVAPSALSPVILPGLCTGMADASVMNLDADLVGSRWGYFDVLDRKVLASLPGDGGLDTMSSSLSEVNAHKRTLQVMVYCEHCQSYSVTRASDAYLSYCVGGHDAGF